MTPSAFVSKVLVPGSDAVPPAMNTHRTRVLLMAIAGIESGWQTRVQVPGGAARSYWQLEQYGAILDVMNDPTASPVVTAFCDAWDIPTDGTTLFDAVAYLDPLAYLIARLALWQVVAPLPAISGAGALGPSPRSPLLLRQRPSGSSTSTVARTT